MVLNFLNFRVPLGLLLFCLLVFGGCSSQEESPRRFILSIDDTSVTKVNRPGTTGVKIMPPKRKPLVFKWKSGPAIYYSDILRYGGEKVTIKLEVSQYGGYVQVEDVQAADPGLARAIRKKVEKWSYTKGNFGKIELTIFPLSKDTTPDLSGLQRTDENVKPIIRRVHNVQ